MFKASAQNVFFGEKDFTQTKLQKSNEVRVFYT